MMMELASIGYGSYVEIKELDTPEFFDMIEHANISADLVAYEAENGSR